MLFFGVLRFIGIGFERLVGVCRYVEKSGEDIFSRGRVSKGIRFEGAGCVGRRGIYLGRVKDGVCWGRFGR